MYRLLPWIGQNPPAGIPAGERIIVAVDFGTTFSGLAWTITFNPSMQRLITQWPGPPGSPLRNIPSDKVPSELGYLDEWGFTLNDETVRFKWFKLDLDPTALNEADRVMAEECRGWSTAVTDSMHPPPVLVERFLTKLRKHAEKTLREALPGHVLQTLPVEYVLTHPTTWSDATREIFELCAEKAGMGDHINLHILEEPAAAAWYVLQTNEYNLQAGDGLVICDVGGGTVDLVSYQIRFSEPWFSEPDLKLDLLSNGRGRVCGSTLVDRAFEWMLYERMKNARGWSDEYSQKVTKFFSETIKPSFRLAHGEVWEVPVPGLPDHPDLNVSDGYLRIDDAHVEQAFKPCIKQIKGLVLSEVMSQNGLIKVVLLVGGFGQNMYLYNQLEMALKSELPTETQSPDGIELLQPPNGWTAVVRGALIHGLDFVSAGTSTVMVSTKRTSKYYGHEEWLDYRPTLHDPSQATYNSREQALKVKKMKWLLRKGEKVSEGRTIHIACCHEQPVQDGFLAHISAEICMFDGSDNTPPPRHRNDDVGLLACLVAETSLLPEDSFRIVVGKDDQDYYVVRFNVCITIMERCTKLELKFRDVTYATMVVDEL